MFMRSLGPLVYVAACCSALPLRKPGKALLGQSPAQGGLDKRVALRNALGTSVGDALTQPCGSQQPNVGPTYFGPQSRYYLHVWGP